MAAESEQFCSDPLNLLVNASVGMWLAGYLAIQTALAFSVLLFLLCRSISLETKREKKE